MFMEALQILQSAGEDDNTFVTDYGVYKIIYILTVYCPFMISTFLLSQEYLGKKIACFPPENLTEGQSGALGEYCWNNGLWVGAEDTMKKSLYSQPHRFYAFYLPVQAILCMAPIVYWNLMTKTRLLAVLRGTEEFFENLVSLLHNAPKEDQMQIGDLATKVKGQLRQFHQICLTSAKQAALSQVLITRQTIELLVFLISLGLQFIIYNHHTKQFVCIVPEITPEDIRCTVPVLDLLDGVWTINCMTLVLSLILISIFISTQVWSHFSDYQPMFFNALPFGDEDDFNENVKWDSDFTKHSYELLTLIMEENNAIMTKVYVLCAMKPTMSSSETVEEVNTKEKIS